MKLKSNAGMATARQVASFKKGEYRGLQLNKLAIREGALDILNKPSRIFNKPVEFRSVFKKESNNGK